MYNLEKILENLMNKSDIKVSDIPDIDLYMDQVLTLFENHFPYNYSEQELTKTMINNYAKGKIINPAIKKKYNKEHILALIIICMLKRNMSLSEIKEIELKNVESVYSHFLEKKDRMNETILPDVANILSQCRDENDEENELLDILILCYYSNLLSEAARAIIRNGDMGEEK